MENCIFLTGGGTAGHTTLNIKLKDELNKYFSEIIYVGSKNGIEKDLIKNKTSYCYEEITTVKLNRAKLFSNFLIPFKLNRGIKESIKLIKKYKPKIIFSKGGYVGLPVTIAGKKMNIPVICHESDLTMGLANKIAKKYAKIICTNFEKTANIDKKKCIFTGMPIKLSNFSKNQAKENLNIKTDKPLLLVTGGSLGAKAINEFIFNNINTICENFYVIHLTGKNNINNKIKHNNYRQIEFFNDMPLLLKACDYALSRAGANTCFELLSNKILTIFIPLPKKSSRGDQIENTKYLASKNLCSFLNQNELNIDNFILKIKYLKDNSKIINNNIEKEKIVDGTSKIISIILKHKLT
ncbi:MAG: UDP-N-acetylglucosamine--N-acetylmuramyl-(pentapeptide) pyrophosphoryl-undecaprenol N-acetylglucosamine transferase [Clostridia bacterium]|nr:UDP-N-acetylglucosamine--N-acetylmuramyl-(pentapeptide) pyrophosphoryl-undecaprenol N-acetylglucosamine transferase [Clostridia bacterium]